MRHRSGTIALVVLLGLGGAGGCFAWRWTERGPARASMRAAVGRFRTSAAPAPAAGSASPAPGVYRYAGSGAEKLSFLATEQHQGPTLPGTVTAAPGGCWRFRLDFNSFHDQAWVRCSTRAGLTEQGGTTDQRFDFVTFEVGEHSRITCSPPIVLTGAGARPGTASVVRCTGRSETTKASFEERGSAVLVGRDSVVVGGVGVPAVHVRERLTLHGGQTGAVRVDIWFASADGLPLQETHSMRVVSPAPAPLNHVTYTEQGGWHLQSTTPRT